MITNEQREQRRKSIGSSDAAAILNCDPWRSRADVYWEKIGKTEDQPSEAMDVGNRLEAVCLDLADERFGQSVRNPQFIDEEYSILTANLDAWVTSEEIIEAKYVGPKGAEYWGEPESDQVPDHIALQVQHQLRVARAERGHIVAAICRPFVGLRFEFFEIQRDDELIDALVTAELAFWKNHVLAKIAPANCAPSLDVLKRLRREPESVIQLPDETAAYISAWDDAKQRSKDSDANLDECYRNLLAYLGDSEAGELPDGRRLIYRSENAGKRLMDTKAAQAAHPEVFETTTRKVLRIKKGSK